MHALDHLINFFDDTDGHHKVQIVRLAYGHSKFNLDIHPHDYYYWIEAIIMTIKEVDPKWYDDQEYYIRECFFFVISFMISFYYRKEE